MFVGYLVICLVFMIVLLVLFNFYLLLWFISLLLYYLCLLSVGVLCLLMWCGVSMLGLFVLIWLTSWVVLAFGLVIFCVFGFVLFDFYLFWLCLCDCWFAAVGLYCNLFVILCLLCLVWLLFSGLGCYLECWFWFRILVLIGICLLSDWCLNCFGGCLVNCICLSVLCWLFRLCLDVSVNVGLLYSLVC